MPLVARRDAANVTRVTTHALCGSPLLREPSGDCSPSLTWKEDDQTKFPSGVINTAHLLRSFFYVLHYMASEEQKPTASLERPALYPSLSKIEEVFSADGE